MSTTKYLSIRITPIYMGSTTNDQTVQQIKEDHPHIHGEHDSAPKARHCLRGSPPYTWGAQSETSINFFAIRITPIYMGSTFCQMYWDSKGEDHPHIHGEHIKRSL